MAAFEAVGRGSIPRWGARFWEPRAWLPGTRKFYEFVLGVWWTHATLRRS